ncbi:MAG: GNAT family N-acetyltransferase [Caldisericia bacterium]|nr:GNAT family N-acetyltransferase [Caldisericia bacterium]
MNSITNAQCKYAHWNGMNSPRLVFRKLTMKDADAIFHYASDPEVTRYVLFPTHKSMDDTFAFIQINLDKYKDEETACWGVTLKDTGELIGTADFVWWNVYHKKAEVGYCFAKEYWNQGFATEALMSLLHFGFFYLNLHRIEARCFEEKIASMSVIEKAGMMKEGVLKEALWSKGKYRNVRQYALLQKEYENIPSYRDYSLFVQWR